MPSARSAAAHAGPMRRRGRDARSAAAAAAAHRRPESRPRRPAMPRAASSSRCSRPGEPSPRALVAACRASTTSRQGRAGAVVVTYARRRSDDRARSSARSCTANIAGRRRRAGAQRARAHLPRGHEGRSPMTAAAPPSASRRPRAPSPRPRRRGSSASPNADLDARDAPGGAPRAHAVGPLRAHAHDLAPHVLDRRHRRGEQDEPGVDSAASSSRSFFSIAVLRRHRSSARPSPPTASPPSAKAARGRPCCSPGSRPQDIARGKFIAAYTTIALYIVVLAPVGALSFLFGGVTATEVVVAFAFLFLFAALAVAFGLAVSSLMSSLRGAIVVTLMLAICIGPMLYFDLRLRCVVRHPQALDATCPRRSRSGCRSRTRARPFGLEYVAAPRRRCRSSLIVVPAWFLYEVTIANLTRRDGRSIDRAQALVLRSARRSSRSRARVPSAVGRRRRSRDGAGHHRAERVLRCYARRSARCSSRSSRPARRAACASTGTRKGAGLLRRFFGPGLPKTRVARRGCSASSGIWRSPASHASYIEPLRRRSASTYWSPDK